MFGMFHTNTPTDPPAATFTATASPTAATVSGTTNLSCSRRLADAHEVVAAPPHERHLLGRCGDTALPRRARQRLDLLESVVERREVPARALGADHRQPAFP